MMKDDASQVAALIASDIFEYTGILHEITGRGTCNRVFVAEANPGKIVIRPNSDRDHREFYKEHWCMTWVAMATNPAQPGTGRASISAKRERIL